MFHGGLYKYCHLITDPFKKGARMPLEGFQQLLKCLHHLITSTIWCITHNRAGLQFMCVLTNDPTSPGKVGDTTEVYVSYSIRTVVWVLLRPTEPDEWKCYETGPTVFRPYPKRLESLTVCSYHCKDSTFSSDIYRPWVLIRPGL